MPLDAVRSFPMIPTHQILCHILPHTCTDFFSPMDNLRECMLVPSYVFRNYYKCPSFNVDFDAEVNHQSCDDYMTVNFTDTSVGATAWEWDVDGDDIIDYTDQNPTHVYTPGVYDVALKIYQAEVKALQKYFLSILILPQIFTKHQS